MVIRIKLVEKTSTKGVVGQEVSITVPFEGEKPLETLENNLPRLAGKASLAVHVRIEMKT